MWRVWVVLAVSGCASFESVDDACPNGISGERHGTPEANELLLRVSCYRRFVGLDRANLNRRINDAVGAHARYLMENEALATNVDWTSETSGETGFTGENALERLEDAGYLGTEETNIFVWEVLNRIDEQQSYTELVDELIVDPFVRDVLLAPAWEGAGYAEGNDPSVGTFAYWNIVLYFPSGARSTRPVTYPMDGQTGLPTTWSPADPSDPALLGLPATVGFPITLTFGSGTLGNNSQNPLNVFVAHSALTGPDGPVEHQILLPGSYTVGTNWSTAILVPVAPLQPATTYSLEARVNWVSRPTGRDVSLSFTTGGESSSEPVARLLPR